MAAESKMMMEAKQNTIVKTRRAIGVDSQRQALLDWFALLAFALGAFGTLWLPDRSEPRWLFAIVLVWLGVQAWRNRKRFDGCNFKQRTARNGLRDIGSVFAFTVIAATVLFVICRCAGAFHGRFSLAMFDKSAAEWLIVKLPTVVFQQIMLQLLLVPILLRRSACMNGDVKIVAIAGGGLFALLHLPNPALVLLTFIAGAAWIFHYVKTQQLMPIMVSHMVLAVLLAGVGGEYVLNMRVGASCLELMPKRVELGAQSNSATYEFPGCVVGCAERLSQCGDTLIVEGWTLDSIHHTSPKSLSVLVDGELIELDDVEFEKAEAKRWGNALDAGFVDTFCYAFVAKFPIEIIPQTNQENQFQIFATNVNGHVARVGQMGNLTAVKPLESNQTIVLFPVEVDGRVDWVDWKPGNVRLRGWAADLRSNALADQVVIESAGDLQTLDLSSRRLPRPGIAKALHAQSLTDSGFEISVGTINVFALPDVRCFAVDEHQRLHPLRMTEPAQQRIAAQMPIGESRVFR